MIPFSAPAPASPAASPAAPVIAAGSIPAKSAANTADGAVADGFAALLDTLASLGLPAAEGRLPSGNIGKLSGKILPLEPVEAALQDDAPEPAVESEGGEVDAALALLLIDPMPLAGPVMMPVPAATRALEPTAPAAMGHVTSQTTGHPAPLPGPTVRVGPWSAPALPTGVMQVALARVEVIDTAQAPPAIQQSAEPTDSMLAGPSEKSQVLPTNLPPALPVTASRHDVAPTKLELLPLTRTPSERGAPGSGAPSPRPSLKPGPTLEAPGETALPSPAAIAPALLGQTPLLQPFVAATAPIGVALSLHPANAPAEMPRDFAALVGRLSQAREEASPHLVRTALHHGQFGPVSLEFRHEERGLAVTMAAAAPGFGGSVQTAVAATLANASENGDSPREGGHQASAHQQTPPGNFGGSAGTDQRQHSAGSDRPAPSGWQDQRREQEDAEDRGLSTRGAGRSDIYA